MFLLQNHGLRVDKSIHFISATKIYHLSVKIKCLKYFQQETEVPTTTPQKENKSERCLNEGTASSGEDSFVSPIKC